MFGIDTIIGLVSLSIAIPGMVQTFTHAGRYLSKRLTSTPYTSEVRKIQELIIDLARGRMRTTLETAEDLYCDTPDTSLKSALLGSIKELWSENRKASEAVLKRLDDMYRLETRLDQFIQGHLNSRSVRSRFELKRGRFSIIGTPSIVPHASVSTTLADFNTHGHRGSQPCLLEEKSFPGCSTTLAYESIVSLARNLQSIETPRTLLQLIGFEMQASSPLSPDRFRLVFAFPEGRFNPRSLRDIYLDPVNRPYPPIPRNYRFILPRKLSEAVYQVHQQNLVHKCIRPESILLFDSKSDPSLDEKYPKMIGTPYLVDWQHVRKTMETSMRQPHMDWTYALYQHPERQASPGSVAESKYNIGHDIYSLGVCFLEIGLWESFVVYDEFGPAQSPCLTQAKQKWKDANTSASELMTEAQIEQKVFIDLAAEPLAFEMGEAYSRLVIKCLTCIEGGFGNTLKFVNSQSRDWDEEGVVFIQQIRKELSHASTMGSGIYNQAM
ncbi:hypothetical protein BDV96DRAFT_562005 [Lophiotrema nucula]|uniref:Protein kinase domain-containing protein n=1 Tax=Lophiotrema nucula TaxID=690887 RepID=A0A6A5ZU01_9PLEO|nr:hypothetical protein BDV96DRAFT_562005 [Lophiotrema nucula]